jgi:uncharacterized membrane protein YuzA (DUF378 family)
MRWDILSDFILIASAIGIGVYGVSGLIGTGFNLVDVISFNISVMKNIIYTLIGVAGVYTVLSVGNGVSKFSRMFK